MVDPDAMTCPPPVKIVAPVSDDKSVLPKFQNTCFYGSFPSMDTH